MSLTLNGTPTSDSDRQLVAFGDHVVRHPALQACESLLDKLHRPARHRASQVRRHHGVAIGPPRGMLITGLTGTGKSTIASQYEQRFPREDLADRTHIPVLRVELPSQPRANVIGEQLLIALGDPFPGRGSGEFRLERAKRLMQQCGTTLLIFDEIQHVTDNLDLRTRDVAADALKNLMSTGIPVAFIGLPSARSYFVKNQQLGRRCTPKVALTPFGIKDEADRKLFRMLLKSLHAQLPPCETSALVDPECTLPLHYASFGLIGQLKQLVEAALRMVLDGGERALSREHLLLAFEQTIFAGCPTRRNPFSMKFDGLPLTEPGEPFHGLA